MNAKKMMIALILMAFLASVAVLSSPSFDAEDTDPVEVSAVYQDGKVYINGTAPSWAEYVIFEIQDVNGKVLNEPFVMLDGSREFSLAAAVELTDGAKLISIFKKTGSQPERFECDILFKPKVHEVQSITLADGESSIKLFVGDSHTIHATISPSNATDADGNPLNGSDGKPLPDAVEWRSGDTGVATVSNGVITAVSAGNTTVTASVGGKTVSCEVRVVERPTTPSTFTFTLKMELDADKFDQASLDNMGHTVADLKRGIRLTGTGFNAGEALVDALRKFGIVYNIPEQSEGASGAYAGTPLQYWIGHIGNIGQVQFPNGDWKYWVQYHDKCFTDFDDVSGNTSPEGWYYDQWTLGYYTEPDHFTVIYGVTSADTKAGERVKVLALPEISHTYTGEDITLQDTAGYSVKSGGVGKDIGYYDAILSINQGYIWEDSTYEDKAIRWQIKGTTDESTVINPDGSVTTTSTETTEGGVIITEVTTKTSEDENGSTVETMDKTITTKDNDGNVTGTTEINQITVTDAGGNITQTSTETVKDKDGNVTEKSEVSTVKDSEVTVTVTTVETASGGKTSVNTKVEAESNDGSITSSAEMSGDGESFEITTTVNADDGTVTKDKIDQALAVQDRVSDAMPGDAVASDKIVRIETSDPNISLSGDVLSSISDSGTELIISFPQGSVQLPGAVLNSLSEEEVSVSLVYLQKADLSESQSKDVADDSTLVDITIVSGGRNLGSDLGGTITVIVKHDSEDGKKVAAYYVAEDGSKEKVRSSYDSAKGEVSLYLTHCSVYEIANEEPSGSSDEEDDTTLYIIIAVIAIAIIAVAAVMILRRH